MRRILHILTRRDNSLAQELIRHQRARTGDQVEVVELIQAEPDYGSLLDKVFESDSVHVW
jgi:hypothetical protein